MRKVDDIQICTACLTVVDGDPADGSAETQAWCTAAAEGLSRNWPGMTVHGTGDEGGFSWSACEGCGNTDGGTRFPAAVLADD